MQPDEEQESCRLPLSTRRVKRGVTEHFRELRMGAFELRGLGSTAVASRPHVEKLKSQAETREPPKQADVREGGYRARCIGDGEGGNAACERRS